jgi:hypothetical protein
MRVIAWNVGPRKRLVGDVAQIIADRDPEVLALFEATRFTLALRLRFGAHYRVIRRRSDVVVLVKRSLPKPKVAVLEHSAAWVGPKAGIKHRGRKHLDLKIGNERLRLVHRIPGGPSGGVLTHGANRLAWVVEEHLLRRDWWAYRGSVIACLGDQNATVEEMVDYVTELGAHMIVTGAKVDWGYQRGYAKARGYLLGRYGSDHRAIAYRLES